MEKKYNIEAAVENKKSTKPTNEVRQLIKWIPCYLINLQNY